MSNARIAALEMIQNDGHKAAAVAAEGRLLIDIGAFSPTTKSPFFPDVTVADVLRELDAIAAQQEDDAYGAEELFDGLN